MWTKIISFGDEARDKFLEGTRKVGMYVGSTMGPAGRNWILQQKYKPPQIHNDGVEVARHIFLEDEIEDLAAQTMVDICMHTNQEAGDGTTTAAVIAAALVERGFKEAELSSQTGISPVSLSEEIYKESPKIIEKLKKQAKKLKKDDLYKVVSTSLRNWETGKRLAEMLEEVGLDGRIRVEENWETRRDTEFQVVKGMKYLGKMVSNEFSNQSSGKDAVWEDTLVMVTNEIIESREILMRIFDGMRQKGLDRLVILNGHSENNYCYSKKFVEEFLIAKRAERNLKERGMKMIQVLPLELPSLTTEQLIDICYYTKAGLNGKTVEEMGYAREVAATYDGNVHILGGKGTTKERIDEAKKQLEIEQDVMFQGKIRDRIASLSAKQGLVRVGAPTEAEQRYRIEKVIDALNAGRAAMEEGIIKGGGVPLKEIAEELGKNHILYEALRAPYDTIQRNAGGKLAIKPEILDAVKVTRLAVENALSAGAQLIATGGGICDVRESLVDKLEKIIEKQFPDSKPDFRLEENQDLGRPTT